jgi:hypothetical protein
MMEVFDELTEGVADEWTAFRSMTRIPEITPWRSSLC